MWGIQTIVTSDSNAMAVVACGDGAARLFPSSHMFNRTQGNQSARVLLVPFGVLTLERAFCCSGWIGATRPNREINVSFSVFTLTWLSFQESQTSQIRYTVCVFVNAVARRRMTPVSPAMWRGSR